MGTGRLSHLKPVGPTRCGQKRIPLEQGTREFANQLFNEIQREIKMNSTNRVLWLGESGKSVSMAASEGTSLAV